MSLVETSGIVIRYVNYRESDRILTLFTREHGLISAAARGCRRPKSKLLSASELFVYGDYILFQNKGKYTVDSCDIRESFYPIREDVGKLYAAAYMLAVANESAATAESNGALMSLLLHALSFCVYGDNEPADIALCFTVRALAVLGFSPAITRCAICRRDIRAQGLLTFSPANGGVLCQFCNPRGDNAISPLSLEAIRRMILLADADMQKVKLPERVRNELRRYICDYAEHVFEKKLPPIDSYNA